ncbi:MAG: hypothetical protein OEZ58_05370 [Gammaproteobacteria bacterium]|nr:hypothetical protein [Gammaproteobacteria bacterium]MDH5728395.1 hypothetical protein [Gammaproteobacteria bacterium]
MKSKICKSCGHVGKPVPQSGDTFFVDLFLWLVTLSVVGLSGLVPLLLIPMLWTVYHLARFNSVQCPECASLDMISLESRQGKALLDAQNKTWTAETGTSLQS